MVTAAEALEFIRKHKGCSATDMAEYFCASQKIADNHCLRLRDLGMIIRHGTRRHYQYEVKL